MAFKKYKVADNAMARLALPINEISTSISLKQEQNLPESGEWIATLVRFGAEGVEKMEKIVVKRKSGSVLTVVRGFESQPLQRESDDYLFLNITAEVIRDLQEALGGAEASSNKKSSIEDNKTSNTFFPTVKAVYDWVVGKLTSKADLVDGKVPAEQLPEMQAIDESNLVHKSGDGIELKNGNLGIGVAPKYKLHLSTQENHQELDAVIGRVGFIQEGSGQPGGLSSMDAQYGLGFYSPAGTIKFYTGGVSSEHKKMEIGFDGTLYVGGQNRTGEWQTYTPTITTGSGNLGEYRIRNGRYKVVGKTVFCAIYLDFKRGEATGSIDVSLPTNSKNHTETPVPIIVGGHGMLYKDTKAKGAIKTGGKLRILKGIVSGVSIQELSPHSESHFVICGEFMYEMP